jgi:hypothetical protein
VSLTQQQQARLEAMKLVMDHPAWCANNGFQDWRRAADAIADWILNG